jgi:hypothetical protein
MRNIFTGFSSNSGLKKHLGGWQSIRLYARYSPQKPSEADREPDPARMAGQNDRSADAIPENCRVPTLQE